MSLRTRMAATRLRFRLRRLRNRYYLASAKDESLISECLEEGAQLRALTGTGLPIEPGLHVGSGGYRLTGWINADLAPGPDTDVVFDATRGLPFRSGRLAWIHSEDFLEHVGKAEGKVFAEEAFRVLRPGASCAS